LPALFFRIFHFLSPPISIAISLTISATTLKAFYALPESTPRYKVTLKITSFDEKSRIFEHCPCENHDSLLIAVSVAAKNYEQKIRGWKFETSSFLNCRNNHRVLWFGMVPSRSGFSPRKCDDRFAILGSGRCDNVSDRAFSNCFLSAQMTLPERRTGVVE